MSSATARTAVISLHRPWWVRLREAWQAAREARAARAAERALWRSLSGLSEATRRDIGVPYGGPAPDDLRLLERAYW